MSLAAEIKSHAQAAETAPPHVVLDIGGMTCAACATRVEAALRQVPRVGQASVNLALERADVVLRSSAVTPSQLAEAVERIGYRAHPRASSLAERRREEQEREAARADAERRQLVLLVASAALTAPLLLPMIAAPFGLHLHLNPWIELALATPVQFVIGARFYQGAWKALRAYSGNMDLLVARHVGRLCLQRLYGARAGRRIRRAPLFRGRRRRHHLRHVRQVAGGARQARRDRRHSRAHAPAAGARRRAAQRPGNRGRDRGGARRRSRRHQIGRALPINGTIVAGESEADESLVTGESLRSSSARAIASPRGR
ncbi:MAG: cation transporter [Rhodoplanes sp.]